MRNLATCVLGLLLIGSPFLAGIATWISLYASRKVSLEMASLISIGVVVSGYGLLIAGSFAKRKAEQRVLLEVDDDALGRIQVRRKEWEAAPFVEQLNYVVKVSAERGAQVPTPEQAALWLEIVKRVDELLAKARQDLEKDAESTAGEDVEFQTAELELTDVRLYPDGGFSFDFAVPRLKERLPVGFYADFSGFEVVESGYVH